MNAKKFGSVAYTAFLKTLLFAFNLIFFAFGLAFFVIGIYGLKVFKEFFSFAPSTTIYIPFITIGLFMMIVGLLSLWCTPKGVPWLLYIYSIIVFLLFVIVLAISAVFMVRRDAFENSLENGIKKAMGNYPADSESIDLMQSSIHCCGSHNYTDWFATQWANNKNNVPKSCCRDKANCTNENLNKETLSYIYQNGCYKTVYDAIETNYGIIGGIGFASAVVIFLGSLLACGLASNIKRNRYEQMS